MFFVRCRDVEDKVQVKVDESKEKSKLKSVLNMNEFPPLSRYNYQKRT